jgi:hypothetical protein
MIGAADHLPPPGRIQPIYLEGKLFPVAAPTAAALGLNDGQVVQATLRTLGSDLSLMLKGQAIEVPASLRGSWVDGQSMWLRVQADPQGGWGLLPLAQSSPDHTAQPLISRVANLLYRPPGDELTQLLNGRQIAEMLKGLSRADLQTQWRALQLSMAQLTPDALRQALMGALGHESWFSRGRSNPGVDPKHFLRSLLTALEDQGAEPDSTHGLLRQAIDALEAQQVQAMQAQIQQEVMFTLTLPFVDANPATLVFRRSPQSDGQPPVFTVNVHSKSDQLGPVWLQTRLTGTEQVDLTMWAQMATVAEQARERQAQLATELSHAGLHLQAFQVIHGTRPVTTNDWTPSGRGLVVDVSA